MLRVVMLALLAPPWPRHTHCLMCSLCSRGGLELDAWQQQDSWTLYLLQPSTRQCSIRCDCCQLGSQSCQTGVISCDIVYVLQMGIRCHSCLAFEQPRSAIDAGRYIW